MPLRAASRNARLRELYIGISNYTRYRATLLPSRRTFVCQAALRDGDTRAPIEASEQDTTEHISTPSVMRRVKVSSVKDLDSVNLSLRRATLDWLKLIPRHRSDTRRDIIHGYFTSIRKAGKFTFVNLVDPQLRKSLQLVIDPKDVGERSWEQISQLRPHTPVTVVGYLVRKEKQHPEAVEPDQGPKIVYHYAQTGSSSDTQPEPERSPAKDATYRLDPYVGRVNSVGEVEMRVLEVIPLNHFPKTIAKADTKFPPEQRYLQLRTDSSLRHALNKRFIAQQKCRRLLERDDFVEIETPILSKSTPEGAREFLVPTRHSGRAYALAQSPQQFKQILMASGIPKYFQFARCFRDEDMRADRQPEFTQLDIEMSFANSEDIMSITEKLINVLGRTLLAAETSDSNGPGLSFNQISYTSAMSSWGSDKPDRRLGAQISEMQHTMDPFLISKITSLDNPIVDMMRLKVSSNPDRTRQFIKIFLDSPSAAKYMKNPDGSPGIAIFDKSKPMNGLAIFEHEAAAAVIEKFHPTQGDLLIYQARPNRPFQGESSTKIGDLRRDLHNSLTSIGLISKPRGNELLWVRDFPLFTPSAGSTDPGQGGTAGLQSTHHPFTAPKHPLGYKALSSVDPLKIVGDHFDLVINGVEVGGGSRRIHDSDAQELVLRDILQVPAAQLEGFRPLLGALSAGCPPHAGIALGFDRLMAVLLQTESVRDVIAFPKMGGGEDRLMGSPSVIGAEAWKDYHMVPEQAREE